MNESNKILKLGLLLSAYLISGSAYAQCCPGPCCKAMDKDEVKLYYKQDLSPSDRIKLAQKHIDKEKKIIASRMVPPSHSNQDKTQSKKDLI